MAKPCSSCGQPISDNKDFCLKCSNLLGHPIEPILSEIERASAANFHYLAIAVALSLPDICAALESPDGTTSKVQYKHWYDQWLADKYEWVTAEDIYSLRCGVIHQGSFGHSRMQYERVMFVVPNSQGVVFHNNILKNALALDASIFCNDMIEAVRRWYSLKKDDPNVTRNMDRLFRLHPNGLQPYVTGLPILA
jgi:hypothetical protein